jgi:hypothetical protein
MVIESLGKDEYWQAEVNWAPLREWYRDGDCGVELSEDIKGNYGIYRFEGRYNNGDPKRLLYIGIAYDQVFDKRLHQGFHESKMKYIKAKEIYVSVGSIELINTIHNRARYEDIESILIYFCEPKLNIKKKVWCPACYFRIINNGHRGVLPRKVVFPVAEITY